MQLFKLIIIALFTVVNTQQIDSKLYAELKSKGEWGDYYLLDGGSYKHVINTIELDSIYLIADNTIEHNMHCHTYFCIKIIPSHNMFSSKKHIGCIYKNMCHSIIFRPSLS